MNRLSSRFLYTAFIINMMLMIVLGLYAYLQLVSTKEATDKLYDHPYVVSNAVKNIRSSIISMHRYMKDVSLAENEKDLNEAIDQVEQEEESAVEEFKVVFNQFLGDKSDVNNAFIMFLKWAPIREEVIRLTKQGHVKEAYSITKNQGASYVEKLEEQIGNLSSFADNKAKRLHEDVSEDQKESLFLLSVFIIVIIIVGFVIFYVLLSTQKKLSDVLQSHLHLIDQNIHIATLDCEGKVVEITSALCRLIGVLPEDVMHQPFPCLINGEDTSREEYEEVLNTNLSGKAWDGEFKRVSDDGEINWVEVSAHPIMDASYAVTGMKIFFKDITHEKENEALAQTDKLTSLLNRRNFESILKRQIRIARRNKLTLEFAILDIDYFKLYNDKYGHPKGDKVLKRIATSLTKNFQRADDYIFRLGGEEFGIIYSLSVGDGQGADRAELLRKQFESIAIPHADSSVSQFVTVSIGTVKYRGDETPSMDVVYREADEALYDAKQKRNCVVHKQENLAV